MDIPQALIIGSNSHPSTRPTIRCDCNGQYNSKTKYIHFKTNKHRQYVLDRYAPRAAHSDTESYVSDEQPDRSESLQKLIYILLERLFMVKL